MNKLLKAEWFRVRKSCHFVCYALLIFVITALLPFVAGLGEGKFTVTRYYNGIEQGASLFIPMFIGVFISVCIGMNYQNKTAYYEIMSGKSITDIIFSRVIVYSILMTCGMCAALGIFTICIGAANGGGDMNKLGLRFLLFAIITFHISIASVLISLCVRSILAPGLILLRFEMLEGMVTMMLATILIEGFEVKEESVNRVTNWFVLSQYTRVLTGKLDNTFIITILASLVLETAIWFAVAYNGFKKKNFR